METDRLNMPAYIGGPGINDPESTLRQSPLWPLQKAMRELYMGAQNSGVTEAQVARVESTRLTVEGMFATWRGYQSLMLLRGAIRALVSPPKSDFSGDDNLVQFQQQILSLAQWDDALPN